MKFLSAIFCFFLLACNSGVSQDLDFKNKFYKRDVRVLFEGKEYFGSGVLPAREVYNLEMTFAGVVDLFTFRSCHREVTQEDAGGGRIFGKKNKVSYVYHPTSIEKEHCPIEIGGFEKVKGRHSWGFFDVQTPMEKLPAVTLCNGNRVGHVGVSVCESLHGLITQIIFTEKVSVKSKPECFTPLTKDQMSFDIIQPIDRCVYGFRSIESGNWHRLTTLGYNDIIIKNLE